MCKIIIIVNTIITENMAILINTTSYTGQPISINIQGTTPTDLKLVGCSIQYGNNDILEPVINWNGTITFFGNKSKFDQFGVIGYKTHKITVNYGVNGSSTYKTFVGYLLPDVYTVPNTGFDENFSINFESTLGQLDRILYNGATNIYSIQQILDTIKNNTDIVNVVVNKSFSEPLSSIMVYSANFINDDNNSENYMKILRDICNTFSMKAILLWTGVLALTSCEILNGTDVYPLNKHMGINETFSVNKTIDTASITVNNYALPVIPSDFSLFGSIKLLDQKPMRIRRGRQYAVGKTGNYHNYWRQIYEFQPGQKAWNFNKYNSSNQLVDEFDENVYIQGGIPLMGAYPIAWSRQPDGGNNGQFEQAIWFKLINGNSFSWNDNLQRMITCKLDNFLSAPNSYFTVNFEAMYSISGGNVNSWNRGWNTDYDADNNATYSSNFDECAIQIDPSISYPSSPNTFRLRMSVKFTDLQGNITYWAANAIPNPIWTSNSAYQYFDIPLGNIKEFVFSGIRQGFMPPIIDANGNKPIFLESPNASVWCRFPATMGTLEISFGMSSNSIIASHILFRNLSFNIIQGKTDSTEVDLSQMDVLYSNTRQAETDFKDTFYMYSDNRYSGRGQLFLNNSDTRVDNLTFQSATEKPEWHRIRVATKWASNSSVYRDVINIDNVKQSWTDRFFNGGDFQLTDGIANVQLIKANQNIGGSL